MFTLKIKFPYDYPVTCVGKRIIYTRKMAPKCHVRLQYDNTVQPVKGVLSVLVNLIIMSPYQSKSIQ